MAKGKQDPLKQLRKLVTRFPEATEEITWNHPTFRIKGKIFAGYGEHEGKNSITVKQKKPRQAELVGDPRFFVPPYVGKHGWVGIYAEEVEWDFVAELVEEAYRLTAPKTLVRKMDESS